MPELTLAGKPTLVDQARAEIEKAELSQTKAAAEIGISNSALSQWLAGRYEGNDKALAGKVRRWIESRAKRSALVTPYAGGSRVGRDAHGGADPRWAGLRADGCGPGGGLRRGRPGQEQGGRPLPGNESASLGRDP